MAYTQLMGRKKLDKERVDMTWPRGLADAVADFAANKGKTRSDLVADTMGSILDAAGVAWRPAVESEEKPVKRKRR